MNSNIMSDPLARFAIQNLVFLLLAAMTSLSAEAAPIDITRIANNLNRPVYLTSAPGESDRLFIVESHVGAVQILKKQIDGSWLKNSQAFLLLSNSGISVSTANEQGLLGMAFHPDYQSNGKFYVSYTANGRSHIAEFLVSSNPDLANASSFKPILSFNRTASNHNGGWIGFGPDRYLYIPTGDSGGGNDPSNSAQNLQDLRGKILRIDVNADDFPSDSTQNYSIPNTNPFINDSSVNNAIWAYGLRNPWRNSFDRQTGDLYIADVGQNALEEINLQSALSTGGENYGWDFKEGTSILNTPPIGFNPIDPIHEYPHNFQTGGVSITGGYIYRTDNDNSVLQGKYLFADFISNKVWALSFAQTGAKILEEITNDLTPDIGSINGISSFGEDANGNIYIVELSGEIYSINSVPIIQEISVPLPVGSYLILFSLIGVIGSRFNYSS